MSATVDIVVKSDAVTPAPVAGVAVSLHNVTTKQLIESVPTDADGVAAFSVPAQQYEVRMFKLGVLCGSPIRIDPPDDEVSIFDVSVHVIVDPVSVDPRTCLCTGRFVDVSNRPMSGVTVRVSPKAEQGMQIPETVDGNQVLGGYVRTLRTDQYGKVYAELFRGGEYTVVWSGEDTDIWNFKVPDRSSANLIDLIHPFPMSLEWDQDVAPGGSVTLAVGETILVPISVLFSDYQTVTEGLEKWLQIQNSNSDVASLSLSGGAVSVTGRSAGTSQGQVSRVGGVAPVVVTQTPFQSTLLAVTVIP
jgi:hypothetical protein